MKVWSMKSISTHTTITCCQWFTVILFFTKTLNHRWLILETQRIVAFLQWSKKLHINKVKVFAYIPPITVRRAKSVTNVWQTFCLMQMVVMTQLYRNTRTSRPIKIHMRRSCPGGELIVRRSPFSSPGLLFTISSTNSCQYVQLRLLLDKEQT